MARSSRGGVTSPETMRSGRLKKILVVWTACREIREDQRRLAAATCSAAALGIVGRSGGDVPHGRNFQSPPQTGLEPTTLGLTVRPNGADHRWREDPPM